MVLQKTSGFLFDLDGVLIDTHDLHWKAWQSMQRELPCLRNMDYQSFKNGFGKSNDTFLHDFDPTSTVAERKLWGEKKEALFRKKARGNIAFLPGIEPFLKEIQEAKIPMIIASSSSIANMEFYLHETPIGHYFTQYTSSEHVLNGKPAPDIFLEAARLLGIPIKSTIILEDSLVGLRAARLAGGKVVALATTYSSIELAAQVDFDLLLRPEDLRLSLFK